MAHIALDAGHGRDAPGRRSPLSLGQPRIPEYVVTRQVARLIGERLIELGHTIAEVFAQQDTTDVQRVHAARGADLLLSIHTSDEDAGLSVHYSATSKASTAFAGRFGAGLTAAIPLPVVVGPSESLLVVRGPRCSVTTVQFCIGALNDRYDLANLRSEPFKKEFAIRVANTLHSALTPSRHREEA